MPKEESEKERKAREANEKAKELGQRARFRAAAKREADKYQAEQDAKKRRR